MINRLEVITSFNLQLVIAQVFQKQATQRTKQYNWKLVSLRWVCAEFLINPLLTQAPLTSQ